MTNLSQLLDETRPAGATSAASTLRLLTPAEVQEAQTQVQRLLDGLGTSILGQRELLELVVICLLARGHILLEGLPGLGKTELVKALASLLGLEFRRVQFTPDLLPGDIVGSPILEDQGGTRKLVFHRGPVFANLVLADEINRATPKTQSALLEAMEERQVSVERVVLPLPADFIVLATQNPRESEGTFPLPESQLDRFMLRVDMGYPARAAESEILARYGGVEAAAHSTLDLVTTIDRALLVEARASAQRIHVSAALSDYVLDIAAATREHPRLALGISTRGAVVLLKAARIYAGLRAGDFVTPDDVKQVAPWILTHRLVLTPEATLEGASDAQVVASLLAAIPVPR